MPASFITARAGSLLELNALVDAEKELCGVRFMHLMEHPKERDPLIMRDCVGYLMARYADEVDSNELAREYAKDLCGFATLPFSMISEVALPRRGVLHSTGAAMVSAICDRQAWLESVGIKALEIGARMGVANATAARRMPTPEKRKMAKDGQLKKSMAELEAEKKKGTLKE